MINVQTLLNEMYYKHGYQHDTIYDHNRYYTTLYNPNQSALHFTIEHDNLENCEFVFIREHCQFQDVSRKRKFKTLKGVVNRIKKIETLVIY